MTDLACPGPGRHPAGNGDNNKTNAFVRATFLKEATSEDQMDHVNADDEGMARIDLAAGFIKANMPLGQGNTLSDHDAWDVAAFIDSHERPKDPRQTGTVAQNAQVNFTGQQSYYGKIVNGQVIGAGTSRQ